MKRRRSATRHDVAIYSPFGNAYYDANAAQGGGAELQMTILARELAARDQRVAHIVFPIAEPSTLGSEALTVYQRDPYRGARPGLNRIREALSIWRALRAVDARVYVVRASAVYVGVVAEFCRLHRRGMVFSTANDFDLAREPIHGSRLKHAVYLHGLRSAGVVVVQTGHQLGLARNLLGERRQVELIRSFAEPVDEQAGEPDSFLWVNRMTSYKRPQELLRLARALPEARFVMVVAPGVEAENELEARIRDEAAGIENLELVGPLRRQDVLARIGRATAIVSTSEWEGMPNVFLEAWGRSVPVLSLSSDPDGLIAGAEMGIVADGSFDGFVAAAASLWTDSRLRSSLGDNARRYVERNHGPAAVCEQWIDVLQGAAGGQADGDPPATSAQTP